MRVSQSFQARLVGAGMVADDHRSVDHRNDVPSGPVQTRYLLIASLVTALVILGASMIWFLMALP